MTISATTIDSSPARTWPATAWVTWVARLRLFRTQVEARLAVFGFIEGWYNPRRRHSALGYQSPVNFERQAYALTGALAGSGPRPRVYARIRGDRARPSFLLPRSTGEVLFSQEVGRA